MENLSVYLAAIFGVLWALSELLTLFPKIKANGVFQLIVNILKWIKDNVIKK